MKTKIIAAHHATPFSAVMTCGLKTAAWASGNTAPSTPGPGRIAWLMVPANYSVGPVRSQARMPVVLAPTEA